MLEMITTDIYAGLKPGTFAGSSIDEATNANIMSALLEALTCPESYELIERDGELYVEAIA